MRFRHLRRYALEVLALRRGGITHHLNSDVPKDVVGDRANVTADVLDEHYDQRSQHERMEQRRGYLDNI